MILQLGPTLGDDYEEVQPQVWVHKTANVFPSAYLGAPCIIGPGTEVRHGAFIRHQQHFRKGVTALPSHLYKGLAEILRNIIRTFHAADRSLEPQAHIVPMMLKIPQILRWHALRAGNIQRFGRTTLIGFVDALHIAGTTYRDITITDTVGRLVSRCDMKRVCFRIVLFGGQGNICVAFFDLLWQRVAVAAPCQCRIPFCLHGNPADKSGLHIALVLDRHTAGAIQFRNRDRLFNAERERKSLHNAGQFVIDRLHILPEGLGAYDGNLHLLPHRENVSFQRFHISLDFHIPIPVFEVDCAGCFCRKDMIQPLPVAFNISPQDEVKHNIALFHSRGIEEGTVDAGAGAGVYRGRRAGQPLNTRDHIVFGIVCQLENLPFGIFDFQCKKAEQIITSPF